MPRPMKLKIPNLRQRRNRSGDLIAQFHWEPSKTRRAQGWRPVPLRTAGGTWAPAGDAALAAQHMNTRLEAWASGGAAPERPDLTTDIDFSRQQPDGGQGSILAQGPGCAQPGTWGAIFTAYEQSSDFQDGLATESQRCYRNAMKSLRAWGGDIPWRQLTKKRVRTNYYTPLTARAPGAADFYVRVLGTIFAWAEENHPDVDHNPYAKFRKARRRAERDENRLTVPQLWVPELADLMVRTAIQMGRPSIAACMMVNLWLGQRLADMRTMRRDQYKDGCFYWDQHKTGERMMAPATPRIAAMLDELRADQARRFAGQPTGLTLFLNEETGQMWLDKSFRHVFTLIRTRAAQTDPRAKRLQMRYIRHTVVTRMAQDGFATPQIAIVTGHLIQHTQSILDTYMVRSPELVEETYRIRLNRLSDTHPVSDTILSDTITSCAE